MFYGLFKSKFGTGAVVLSLNGALVEVFLPDAGIEKTLNKKYPGAVRKSVKEAAMLENYFAGNDESFKGIKIDFSGLPLFTVKVLKAIRNIPRGETVTYKQAAAMAGNIKAARAAGSALSRNPVPVIIPCHRVLAKNGLGGFSAGIKWKLRLLEIEKKKINREI
ncbi:MAG: 6-O-methylguanine DNA methyltransferase [Candidatus Goldiibacteriota bacterium HGW-Goldbacteria-1]|jgi:methylated-DNA-[protein]-cysteine S-methyltransferase|nr:MAG: 6-O-methylguanine DNA methyltransferase [Candidatus Goldiibacteriota bacterium HGW-Goldbacteria-1]